MSTADRGIVIHVNGSPRMGRVPRATLEAWAGEILSAEKRTGEVSVTFVDTETMTDLNERYTGRKGTTDVLAFSQQEGVCPAPDPRLLGDVLVDVQQVRVQARHFGVSSREELLRVVAHGILHLLGYDHAKPEEETRMRLAEERHLLRFGRRHQS